MHNFYNSRFVSIFLSIGVKLVNVGGNKIHAYLTSITYFPSPHSAVHIPKNPSASHTCGFIPSFRFEMNYIADGKIYNVLAM